MQEKAEEGRLLRRTTEWALDHKLQAAASLRRLAFFGLLGNDYSLVVELLVSNIEMLGQIACSRLEFSDTVEL
jgi:hypothetical protein